MKKNIKKILHNCPYLTALLATWLFLTAGGFGLMVYRDSGRPDWKSFWENPFFAVVMEEEMRGGMGSPAKVEAAMAKAEMPADNAIKQDEDKTTRVILDETSDLDGTSKGDTPDGIRKESNDMDSETKHDGAESLEKPDMEPDAVRGGQVKGRTVFVPYSPAETHSVYYTDVGEVALTTEYPYTTVGEDYFDDAAFIGDSRTLGISDYSGLNADFYCENGMTIYKMFDEKGIVYQKNGEKVNLGQVLQQKKYGKIYIMLGMNELGYRDTGYFMEKYREVLEQIREWQPQGIIYVMANLHVSEQKNNNETEFNNININAKNDAAARLADGVNIFYLDSNPLFTDDNGFLKADLTFDGVHLYADNYAVWKSFLMEHGVIREDEGTGEPESKQESE